MFFLGHKVDFSGTWFGFLLKFNLNYSFLFLKKDFLKNKGDCFNCFACQQFRTVARLISINLRFPLSLLTLRMFDSLKKMFDFFGLNTYICSP